MKSSEHLAFASLHKVQPSLMYSTTAELIAFNRILDQSVFQRIIHTRQRGETFKQGRNKGERRREIRR